MSAQHKICSDITKNDLTLVETYAIALNFGSDTCQIKVGIVQVNTKSGRKMSDVRLLFHALRIIMFVWMMFIFFIGSYSFMAKTVVKFIKQVVSTKVERTEAAVHINISQYKFIQVFAQGTIVTAGVLSVHSRTR